MKKTVFSQIEIGDAVVDKWYGPGIVLAKTARTCTIKLYQKNAVWKYDTIHINAFIELTSPKRSAARKHSGNNKKRQKSSTKRSSKANKARKTLAR